MGGPGSGPQAGTGSANARKWYRIHKREERLILEALERDVGRAYQAPDLEEMFEEIQRWASKRYRAGKRAGWLAHYAEKAKREEMRRRRAGG